ncbi:MAG TPA: hypothetical protein VLY24_20240 [Bryobacteraceae bacterium]|nr:hypothetical protein [Bryobacteraceae bacterium]
MDELLDAEEACLTALARPELRRVGDQLAQSFDAFTELAKVTAHPESVAHLTSLIHSAEANPVGLSRWLLLRGSLQAIPRVASWRVFGSVKRLWIEEVLYYTQPRGDLSIFAPEHVRFREMARIVTLRRYPAGQFHWEITGFPRSWIARTAISKWPRLLSTLSQMGGFQPLVETHINERRTNRPVLTESEGLRSYYRLARSIELQPEVRGFMACSWLYCSQTAEVTPHLAWLRKFFLDRGAFIGTLGPAPPDSGFLSGELRRTLYNDGRYRPLMTYVLWPRRSILDWARTVALEKTDPRV